MTSPSTPRPAAAASPALDAVDLDAHAARVRRDGYTVLERVIPVDTVAAMVDTIDRIEREHGLSCARTTFEGLRTLRVNNLLALDEAFWPVPLQPQVLGIAERLLDAELLLHSLCTLVTGPGQEAQPVHEDTQLIPLPRPHLPIVVNAIWALSDFTERNGATRIVPGSHLRDHAPDYGRPCDTIAAEMPAGSVMVFDSALWHGAGANLSEARRYALSCAYCAGWLRQQENFQLGIARETAARFPRRLQQLCGYGVYRGQFGHIDNRDPIELLGQPRARRMVWEASDVAQARKSAGTERSGE